MQNFRLFGTVTKTEEQDDGTIKVYGVASSGGRDTAGEIIMPDAMKAALPDYSRFPALREMHQPQAAGKVLEAAVNDDGETDIVALVVDPIAVKKVKTGVYPAFSIGGKVTKRDPSDRSVITGLRLVEISLVDSPCNPDAVLSMWKANSMATEFKPANTDVIARAKQLAKAAGSQRFKEFLFEASQELVSEHLLEKGELADPDEGGEPVVIDGTQADPAPEPKEEPKEAVADAGGDPPEPEAVVVTGDTTGEEGDPEPKEAVAEGNEPNADADPVAELQAAIDKAKAKDEPYGDVEYADPGYQEDGKKRYPLDSEEHIRAAWNYIHKASNRDKYSADQVSKIEAKIVAAWKSKIDKDGPPSAEKTALVADLAKTAAAFAEIGVDVSKLSDDAVANQAAADALGITKSLYLVSSFACALQNLASIQSSIEWEEQYEGDDSSMAPTKLAQSVSDLGAQLVAYAQEEVAELVESISSNAGVEIVYVGDDCAYAASVVDLTKADEELMAKAGARHSKADKAAIQQAHDAMTKLGASCSIENCDKSAQADELEALTAENERLSKALTEAAPQIEELSNALKAEIAELRQRFEDEPLPPKTAGPAVVKVVEKSEDSIGGNGGGNNDPAPMTDEQFKKYWDGLSSEERGELQVRIALSRPQALATALIG